MAGASALHGGTLAARGGLRAAGAGDSAGGAGRQVGVSWLARVAGTNRFGTTLAGLERAAEAAGLRAEAVQMDLPALRTMEGMGIAWVDGDHYAAVMSIRGDEARIHDPNQPAEETISTARLLRRSGGIVLTLER
jgi:ABC-type bacteriocin/lantibiotic exporter with double-glycine peptidase domain